MSHNRQSSREMLRVLETGMLRSLFDSVMKSITARVDDVMKSVALLKIKRVRNQYSQQDIEDVKPLTSKLEKSNTKIDQLTRTEVGVS